MSEKDTPVKVLEGGAGTGSLLSREDLDENKGHESAELHLRNSVAAEPSTKPANTETSIKPALEFNQGQEMALPFSHHASDVLPKKSQGQVKNEPEVGVDASAIPEAQSTSVPQSTQNADVMPDAKVIHHVPTGKPLAEAVDNRGHDGDPVSEQNEQPPMTESIEREEAQDGHKEPRDADTQDDYSPFQREMIEIFRHLKKEEKSQESAKEKTPELAPAGFKDVLIEPVDQEGGLEISPLDEVESSPLEVEETSQGLSSGIIFGLIGLSLLFLGGIVVWVMSSPKDNKASSNEASDKNEVEETLRTENVKSSNDEFEEIVISPEEKEEVVVEEKIPDAPQDKKPISKDITFTLDGESPYSIGKKGFFFRDDDDDSLRGLVIKSLPDRGELKSKGSHIPKDEFFKIDDLADIDDIELTYHLEKDEEPSSFEFALVSGDSVVSQQSSDDYTYTFESASLSGLPEGFILYDLNVESYFPLSSMAII